MLYGKILYTLVGIAVTLFALFTGNFADNHQEPVIENFWGTPSFSTKMVYGVMDVKTGKKSALGLNMANEIKARANKYRKTNGSRGIVRPKKGNPKPVEGNSEDFIHIANRQAMLSPRMMSSGYGPYINSSRPSLNNTAVPKTPVPWGGSNVSEGFEDDQPKQVEGLSQSDIPIGKGVTESGDRFITFKRLMYSNKRPSRNYGQGDFIRGDLPIKPCNTGWFSVSPDISRDLNPGAMNVIGGLGAGDNKLYQMLLLDSGGKNTTQGGADLNDISNEDIKRNVQDMIDLQRTIKSTN